MCSGAGKEENRTRVSDSPGSPGMATLPRLVQKWPWSPVPFQRNGCDPLCSSRLFQQVLPRASSGLGCTSAPIIVHWALGNQGTPRKLTSSLVAALVTGGKGPWGNPQPGRSSGPAPAWTCYVEGGPSSPLGLRCLQVQQSPEQDVLEALNAQTLWPVTWISWTGARGGKP